MGAMTRPDPRRIGPRRARWTLPAAAAVLVLAGALAARAAGEPIRLGWQVPWATQGQLVAGLKHTNLPELVGVELEYVGFTYGAPLNRAALAGEVDVLLTADQPALVLLSRTDRFRVVARMMYNRVCVYVPVASEVRSLGELEGKSVMGPTGAAAERVALAALREAGVPLSRVRLGNLDMAQQSALLERPGSEGRWRGVDALYGFDPLPAVFESEGKARMLHCDKVVSLVLASREMMEERPDELRRFLRAFALSWYHFSQNPRAANRWFAQEARLDVEDEVLDRCASVEPNRWVESLEDLRLTLSRDDYRTLDEALGFLRERDVVREPLDYRAMIDLEPLATALEPSALRALWPRVRTESPGPAADRRPPG